MSHRLTIKNVPIERKIKRHRGVVHLLSKNEKTINDFICQCVSSPVGLSFMRTDAFIKITGLNKTDVDIAADIVAEYGSNVAYGTVEVDTPGLKIEMFGTKDTSQNNQIELLENRHECAIEVRNYKIRQEATASVQNLQSSYRDDQTHRVTQTTNIKVVSGNITKFKADILVNTIAYGSLEKGGMVLKQFLEAGGPSLEKELRQFKIPVKFGKDVVLTSAHENIDAKFILHVAVANFKNERSLEKLYSTIKKCLEIAMSKNATTIAFPTLGCGKLAFSPENMISCFFRAEIDTQPSLDIFVVAFEDDLRRKIESHLQDLLTSELDEPESNLIVFHINALSHMKLLQAKTDLIEKISAMIAEETIKDDIIAQLDEGKLLNFRKLGKSQLVHIEIDQNLRFIRIQGERTRVEIVKQVILTKLESIRDIDRFPVYWTIYKFPGNTAADAKPRRVLLHPQSPWYSEVSQVVTQTWDQQSVGQGFDAKGLGSHAIEVLNIFCIESPVRMEKYMALRKCMSKAASSIPFRQLQGQNNERDILTMTLGLQQLYGTLSREVNEVFLLHGTKSDALKVIENDGIDTRLCGSHPLFGFGAYFAESSTKADQYADPKEQRTSLGQSLYVYLCRVLLGSVYVCDDPQNVKDYKRPPCMQPDCQSEKCPHTAHYDSVVGTHRPDPARNGRLIFREFVVYHPDQSYPDFLIEYKRVKYP